MDVVVPRVPRDTCMLRIVCMYIHVYTGMNMVGQGSECVHCGYGSDEGTTCHVHAAHCVYVHTCVHRLERGGTRE